MVKKSRGNYELIKIFFQNSVTCEKKAGMKFTPAFFYPVHLLWFCVF